MEKIRIVLGLLIFLLSRVLIGQDATLTNTGATMVIQKGVHFYVDGDYEDKGVENGIVLEGTFEVTKNLYNHSNRGTLFSSKTVKIDALDSVDFTFSKVIFSGVEDQFVGGDYNSFFPSIEVAQSSSSHNVILNRSIDIRNKLLLTEGGVHLNGDSITLSEQADGILVGENEVNRVFGRGVIRKLSKTYNATDGEVNIGGLGLSLDPATGIDLEVTRKHSGFTNVADTSLALQFVMKSKNSSSIVNKVGISSYLNIPTDPEYAIYFSKDSTIWTPYDAIITNQDRVRKATVTPDSTDFSIGSTNYFTLGLRYCSTINNPIFKIDAFVTIPDGDGKNDNNNVAKDFFGKNEIDVCDLSSLVLKSSDSTFPYYQWQSHATFDSTTLLNQDSINIRSVSEDASYTLLTRNNRGCEASASLKVNARDNPVAKFIIPESQYHVCGDYSIAFKADLSRVEGSSTIAYYHWNFGDTSTTLVSSADSISYAFKRPGFYNISLNVETNHGCKNFKSDSSSTGSMEVYAPPTIDPIIVSGGISSTASCEQQELVMKSEATYTSATNNNLANSLQFRWDFGDGINVDTTSGGTSEVKHRYFFSDFDPDNDISINLTVEDVKNGDGNSRGCLTNASTQYFVYPKPSSRFDIVLKDSTSKSITEVCEEKEIVLIDSSELRDGSATIDSIVSYQWDFGNGDTAVDKNPSTVYTPDSYNIELITTTDFGCKDTTTFHDFLVHPLPKGTTGIDIFSAYDDGSALYEQSTFCLGDTVTFVNEDTIASGVVSYEWDFGDGSTSTEKNPKHIYASPGRFQVKLNRISDQGCESPILPFDINIRDFPAPSFEFANQCDGTDFTFYNTSFLPNNSTDVTYLWEFGDGDISTEVSPVHTYRDIVFGSSFEANFDVKLTVTSYASGPACDASIMKTVTVHRNPSFELPQAFLSFDSAIMVSPFDDPNAIIPSGSSYRWSDRNGNTRSTDIVDTIYNTGSYFLEVQTPFECSQSNNFTVHLLDKVSLGSDRAVCSGVRIDAAPSSASLDPDSYRWYQNGSIIQDSTLSFLDVSTSATYWVEVTYNLLGVTATTSDTINISVDTPPTLMLDSLFEICTGQTQSIDAGIEADSYLWTNAAGDIIATTKVADFDRSGDFSLEITKGACSTKAFFKIVLLPSPKPFFYLADNEVCIGDVVSFSSSDTIGTINWNLGDGSQKIGPVISHSFDSAGTYTVALSITNASGCTESYMDSISVNPYPVASFEVSNACAQDTVSFTNTSIIPLSANESYNWDFGDGLSSTEEAPIHIYSKAGTYEVILSVQSNGCMSTTSQSVTIYQMPFLGFGDQVTTCGNEVVLESPVSGTHRWFDSINNTLSTNSNYTAKSSGAIGLEYTSLEGCSIIEETEVILQTPIDVTLGAQPIAFCETGVLDAGTFPNATYLWSTGDTTQRITVSSSGEYFVKVTDSNSCEDSDQVQVIVYDQPSVSLGPDISVCDTKLPVTLTVGMPAERYIWSTGDTTSSIQVSQEGIYKVEISNGNGSCVAEDDIRLFVNESPNPLFTSSNVCLGESTTFQNLTGNNSFEYTWDFGDGSYSPLPSPNHTYAAPGDYLVVLTAKSADCSASVSQNITVYPTAIPDFEVSSGCAGLDFDFTNTSTNGSSGANLIYDWDFGDGNTSQVKNPINRYNVGGAYTVGLTVSTPYGCTQTLYKEVEVFKKPSLDFGDTISTCGLEWTLDAQNTGSTYLWQDNSTNQELIVRKSGTYSVKVTSEKGCEVEESVYVNFKEINTPNLGTDLVVCGEVKLSANVDAFNYLWSTGETSPSITVYETGVYSVQTISKDLCTSTDEIHVLVNDIPVFDLGADQQTCAGDSILLNIQSGETFKWNTGQTVPSIAVYETGTIQATAISKEGCTYDDEINVTFFDLPSKPFEERYDVCDSVQLETDGMGNTYQWSTGSTESSETVKESGIYWVQVTSPESCIIYDSTYVEVSNSPVVSLGRDIEICFGESTALYAGDQNLNNSVFWNTGETTPSIEVGTGGIYWVEVTNEKGCTTRDYISIIELPPIELNLGEDFIFCKVVELDAGLENMFYTWKLPDGSNEFTRKILAEEDGEYTLLVEDVNGCYTEDKIILTKTTEEVDAHFLAPSIVLEGNRVVFQALSEEEVIFYRWDFGDGSYNDENISNPVHRYTQSGVYLVTLTYTNGVCTETLTKEIEVLPRNSGRLVDDEVSDIDGQELFVEILKSDVFPNPIKDVATFNIQLSSRALVEVKVTDLAGETYLWLEHYVEDDRLGFDFSTYEPGIYIVSLKVGTQFVTHKIVKMD